MSDPLHQLNRALGHRYEVERELGVGGMATVYLARDLKHDRQVALKVLRPEVAAAVGGDRFLSEIRTTARLRHPHILSLFDSGAEDGLLYYVMPYVAGESLQDRLERERQLPVDEAVQIAVDVAGALEFAHGQGVVHRDIKPGNILLEDGRAYVTDFGIALALRDAGSARLTETGTRVGTPLYMSPEQAAGDGVIDGRSDVYSTASVLYEMLAGEPPVTGSSAPQILARLVVEEPRPLSEVRSAVPPNVEAAVAVALAKLPADRFQTAGAFGVALEDPGFRQDPRQAPPSVPDAGPWRKRALIGLAATVVLLLVAAWGWLRPVDSGSARALVQAMVPAPTGAWGFTLSPDGRTLAYRAPGGEGRHQLWIQPLDAVAPRPLEGTEGARLPFWAPDGESLAFFADGSLKSIPVTGGAVAVLASASSAMGGAWSPDGRIIFAPHYSSALFEVPEEGGTPAPVTELDTAAGEKSHRWPLFLPGGQDLLFLAQTAEYGAEADDSRLEVLGSDGQRREVLRINSSAEYAAGHLFYWRGGTLYAHPFDTTDYRVTGTPRIVAEDVAFDGAEWAAFSASSEGTLVYRAADPLWRLEWRDRAGRLLEVAGPEADYNSLELSRDGTRVTYREGQTLWVRDLARGTRIRLTFEDDDHRSPTWSPDGEWVAYGTDRTQGRGGDVYRVRSSGAGEREHLFGSDTYTIRELRWSDDGRSIVIMMGGALFILDLDSGEARLAVATPGTDLDGGLSPDGRWLAYSSDESGRPEVYVTSVSEDARRWLISQDGGFDPVWSSSGDELLFFGSDYEIRSVTVTTGPEPEFGVPETLFKVASPGEGHVFEPSPDGRLLLRTHEASGDHQNLRLVLGWPALIGEDGR
jgi:serine/threonine-protein kinase